jgi:hypothetical protein
MSQTYKSKMIEINVMYYLRSIQEGIVRILSGALVSTANKQTYY